MWCIKGIIRWGYGYGEEENIVATFDTENDAKQYIKRATLKQAKWRKKFKMKSLLGGYDSAWVEEYKPETYTHNPPVNF